MNCARPRRNLPISNCVSRSPPKTLARVLTASPSATTQLTLEMKSFGRNASEPLQVHLVGRRGSSSLHQVPSPSSRNTYYGFSFGCQGHYFVCTLPHQWWCGDLVRRSYPAKVRRSRGWMYTRTAPLTLRRTTQSKRNQNIWETARLPSSTSTGNPIP